MPRPARADLRGVAPLSNGELRSALARPGVYPGHPAVEVRETHISVVFLAGERAYKLKKPLVLPFLDYGTAERRREMCHEEVRLNRRLAPDIYLGVRGVAPAKSGAEVALVEEDDPRAVDFVVEMRRYDESRSVAAVLERGELRRDDIAAVARTLAGFHASCEPCGDGAGQIEREVDRNVGELLGLAELASERRRIRPLARFLHAFLGSRWDQLDARAKRGMRRDCHGDLRVEHVLLSDPVRVVDCVEFDPALRRIDVADDLAFLVMDLASLGGERFGAMLLESYRAAGGDCGDEPLVSFFAVHRALIRAKVLLVRAAQQPPGSAAHAHASAQVRELLAVAERFAWRARLPRLLVLCGGPASGKSHLACALAAASGLPLVASDPTRKQLAGIRPTEAASPEHYSAEFSRHTYAEMGRRAAAAVRAHQGALVDGTFRNLRDRQAFRETFDDAAPLVFVECVAPVFVLAERARRREHDRKAVSDANLLVVLRERTRWEPLDEVPASAHLIVRTDRPVDTVVEDLAALLDARLADPSRDQ